MFNVQPVSSSNHAITPPFNNHDPSHTPSNHGTDVVVMMINNHKDGIKDQPHVIPGRLNGNHIDSKKKTSRGPAPTPPPKPPDLMKKGVTSTVPSLPIQPKSEVVGPNGNCNSAQVHLSTKPIKPPKPVGLLNKANHHHVQFNPVSEKNPISEKNPVSEKSNTVDPIGTSENSIEEQLNGNGSDSPHDDDEEMVVGGNGVDENANVPEAEHITNHEISSEQNSPTAHHDSPGDYPDMMEKVVSMSSTRNGLDSEARNHHELLSPPSSLQNSSISFNAGNGVVSRETVTESKPHNSSSFIDRGGIISSSVSTMNATQNQSNITSSNNTTQSNTTQCNVNPMAGLNRRNSNIEKLTSRITTTHIQRSFSSASSRIDFKSKSSSSFNPSSSLYPSSGIIKPAKSTASVDSDDSSDEMDVAIELSVGLQRELRQFLEKRRYREQNNRGSTAARLSRGSLERESNGELLRQQSERKENAPTTKTSSSTSFSSSKETTSFQQLPPTHNNNGVDQTDSKNEKKRIESVSQLNSLPSSGGNQQKSDCDQQESDQIPPIDEEEDVDSVNGLDQEEVRRRKKQQKLYFIAKEITSSESDFVDKLHLLNNEFRTVAEKHLPPEALKSELQLFKYLPQLTSLSENFLAELQSALDHWPRTHKIAHVIVKIGPFLKHYSSFIQEFDKSTSQLDDAVKKYPNFAAGLRELESTPRCGKLLIKHYLLKPIQRIPQYRLLLQDYKKNLPPGHPDEKDTETALKIVSDVAEHANNTMKQCENFVKLQAIQNNLLGNHEIIRPGRILLKEGDMFKRSRRSLQPRRFILCSDCLLYMTLLQTGTYRLNHEIPLSGMRIILPQQYDFKSELTIRSPKRSFTIVANDENERDGWYEAINKAINDHNCRRNTLSNNLTLPNESNGGSRPSSGSSSEPSPSFGINLGDEQPVWIPDSRVTMCQLCTAEFSLIFRRHHCRACGLVVCEACSSNRAPLKYLNYKPSRVCDECNTILLNRILERKQRKRSLNGNDEGSEKGSISSQTNLEATPEMELDGEEDEPKPEEMESRFKRVTVDKTRASQRIPKIPGVRKVPANDPNAEMSGYLLLREKKKTWNKFWFMVKELDTDIKILYKFKESEDVAALDSVPLLGWYVSSISGPIDGHPEHLLFQLTHPGLSSYIFKSEDELSKERWMKAMEDCIKV